MAVRPAPKGNKYGIGNKGGGRPTMYRPEYPEIARRLCLLKNATDEDLAVVFDVSIHTINHWKMQKPLFKQAILDGKENADAMVASMLYQRAVGYDAKLTRVVVPPAGKTGRPRKPITVDYIQHYPPDVGAQKHWLSNRQRGLWNESLEITGANGGAIPVRFIIEGGPSQPVIEGKSQRVIKEG